MKRINASNNLPPAMNSILFIVLRRMRIPLIMVITAYAIAVFGLTIISGRGPDGGADGPPMSYFHAFYFISYTATTTGYGEPPQTLTDGQRLWVTFSIYMTVISWGYNILTLFSVMQDKGFRSAFALIAFRRKVNRLHEPFYLVCGCGETGGLVCTTLDRRHQHFVIVEQSEERVQELGLMTWRGNPPILNGDARQPDNLIAAGLTNDDCQGVLALSRDEDSNLAVAIAVRLLHPDIPVLAAVRSPATAANMASFGTDHIINPFEIFAGRLAVLLQAPQAFLLSRWLTGIPGDPSPEAYHPPHGKWIVCGFGRFGQAVTRTLEAAGQSISVIEPRTDINPEDRLHIVDRGMEAGSLTQAGIHDAVGIVAGTDSDVNNLSIAVTAREIKPEIFVVMRQNLASNNPLFEAYEGDFALVTSELIAQECLAILTTPLLSRFLAHVRQQGDDWAWAVLARLATAAGERLPHVWAVRLDNRDARAMCSCMRRGKEVNVSHLVRDPGNREQTLRAIPLLLVRDDEEYPLPAPSMMLMPGDCLLFAGRSSARNRQLLAMQNTNALDYVLTGHDAPGGWVWHRWSLRRGMRKPANEASHMEQAEDA